MPHVEVATSVFLPSFDPVSIAINLVSTAFRFFDFFGSGKSVKDSFARRTASANIAIEKTFSQGCQLTEDEIELIIHEANFGHEGDSFHQNLDKVTADVLLARINQLEAKGGGALGGLPIIENELSRRGLTRGTACFASISANLDESKRLLNDLEIQRDAIFSEPRIPTVDQTSFDSELQTLIRELQSLDAQDEPTNAENERAVFVENEIVRILNEKSEAPTPPLSPEQLARLASLDSQVRNLQESINRAVIDEQEQLNETANLAEIARQEKIVIEEEVARVASEIEQKQLADLAEQERLAETARQAELSAAQESEVAATLEAKLDAIRIAEGIARLAAEQLLIEEEAQRQLERASDFDFTDEPVFEDEPIIGTEEPPIEEVTTVDEPFFEEDIGSEEPPVDVSTEPLPDPEPIVITSDPQPVISTIAPLPPAPAPISTPASSVPLTRTQLLSITGILVGLIGIGAKLFIASKTASSLQSTGGQIIDQLRNLGLLGETIPAGLADVLNAAIQSVGGILDPVTGEVIESKLIEARNLILDALDQLGLLEDGIPVGLIETIDQALISAAKGLGEGFLAGLDLTTLVPIAAGGLLLFLLLGDKKKKKKKKK